MTRSSATRQAPATSEQIEGTLRRSPLFAPLPRAAWVEFAARARSQEYARGDRLVECGDCAGHLALVVRGRLGSWAEGATGTAKPAVAIVRGHRTA